MNPISHALGVLALLAVGWVPAAVSAQASTTQASAPTTQHVAPTTQPVLQLGRLEHPPLKESSGLVASRRYPGVYWTHNDGGNPSALYAIDRTGRLLREYPVVARNIDWEDMAIDDGMLYLADIGNNTGNRRTVHVYQFVEPDPMAAAYQLRPRLSWSLRYPDDVPFDSEAFFVLGGHGYLISKDRNLAAATLYRFELGIGGGQRQLQAVMQLPLRVPVTAADVSEDGRWLVVLTVMGPRVFEINGDLSRLATEPPLSATFIHPTQEAACLTSEGVLATTEARHVLLFTWEQLRAGALLVAPVE